MKENYVHGYSERESTRLSDQADALTTLIHHDTLFPAGSRILEAGCGVGAQTTIIASQNPNSHFVSIDISESSVAEARAKTESLGIANVDFFVRDLCDTGFEPESFDALFLCFVLEHLPDPKSAILSLKRLLKPGAMVMAIEGDHGSAYFYPENDNANHAIDCQTAIQASNGGNSLIGRQLYPLLSSCGFLRCKASPRMIYADGSNRELQDAFTLKTFTAMIEGVREQAIAQNRMSAGNFDAGIAGLKRSAEPDGVFCYTFFKAIAFSGQAAPAIT